MTSPQQKTRSIQLIVYPSPAGEGERIFQVEKPMKGEVRWHPFQKEFGPDAVYTKKEYFYANLNLPGARQTH